MWGNDLVNGTGPLRHSTAQDFSALCPSWTFLYVRDITTRITRDFVMLQQNNCPAVMACGERSASFFTARALNLLGRS